MELPLNCLLADGSYLLRRRDVGGANETRWSPANIEPRRWGARCRAGRPTVTFVGVQSVERASRLLKLLATTPGYVRLADLAESAGLAKSTTHGLLQTLVREGLVEHDPASRHYRLGNGLVVPARICGGNDTPPPS